VTEHTSQRVVLGFAGTAASIAALRQWRAAGSDVVTVTIDVGQARDVDEVREQALAAGALRAHVFDLRLEFARDVVLPALRSGSLDALGGGILASPLVERKLAEVAAIERAATIDGSEAFDVPEDPERRRRRSARTLLERTVADVAQTPDVAAQVALTIDNGVPSAINGVPLDAAELLESLALIAGQHGIGRLPHLDAPAIPVVHAAYAALDGGDGTVHFVFHKGRLTLTPAHDDNSSLVNHA
jgi:argininosuccinate synthase